jgi:hypothetical protein
MPPLIGGWLPRGTSGSSELVKRNRIVILAAAVLAAAAAGVVSHVRARESRLSSAVAFVSKSLAVKHFLDQPGAGYVQAYFRFGPDFPDDVIVGIDQELLEGVDNPLYVPGGDWMAFVGVQRTGAVWVGAGSDRGLKGTASRDRDWKIYDLKTPLEPDVWYRMRVEADFGSRRFKSFTIDGPGIKHTLDLSSHLLDYPNYMPFNSRSMIYIVAAMRGRSMMKRQGTPIVYFDDVEGGISNTEGKSQRIFFNDFEDQSEVTAQPLSWPVIKINSYQQKKWYLERAESLFHIEHVPFARSGTAVGVADVNLD